MAISELQPVAMLKPLSRCNASSDTVTAVFRSPAPLTVTTVASGATDFTPCSNGPIRRSEQIDTPVIVTTRTFTGCPGKFFTTYSAASLPAATDSSCSSKPIYGAVTPDPNGIDQPSTGTPLAWACRTSGTDTLASAG